MTLGELKKSLARMSPDLDECEVLINFTTEDGTDAEYDQTAFTGYSNLPNDNIVILIGTLKEAIRRMNTDSLRYPDGSVPKIDPTDLE